MKTVTLTDAEVLMLRWLCAEYVGTSASPKAAAHKRAALAALNIRQRVEAADAITAKLEG